MPSSGILKKLPNDAITVHTVGCRYIQPTVEPGAIPELIHIIS